MQVWRVEEVEEVDDGRVKLFLGFVQMLIGVKMEQLKMGDIRLLHK